jgi:hypothetical protein
MVPTSLEHADPHQLVQALIETPDLDEQLSRGPEVRQILDARLRALGDAAWNAEGALTESARLASLRCLYALNRLRLYWGDDPDRYLNERSSTLMELQRILEEPWQTWLERRVSRGELEVEDPTNALAAWAARDRTPRLSPQCEWVADSMGIDGYRRLLEVSSLNGLVEASQLSRALGGAPTPVQATLSRIFVEEYGAGRLAKKHSTYFARMLEDQGLRTEPEAYFERVPWEVLGVINHAFYLAENKRHYLRFCGAFTYTETSTPAGFWGYACAAKRLGLSDGSNDYWALHVREDERHGAWMVEQVALPLLQQFPGRQREVLLGYLLQREVEGLAGEATYRACREAERGLS